MKIRLIILIIILIGIGKINGCTTSMPSLIGLSIGATNIVEGKVVNIQNSFSNTKLSIVSLEVKNILKGNIKRETLTIQVNLDNNCPGPAEYKMNEIVIAFLYRNSKDNDFVTYSNAYGVKYFENEIILKLFTQRIIEIIEIQSLKKEKHRTKEFIKWTIRCVKNDATRWEGAFELSHQGSIIYEYDDQRKRFKRKKHSKLNRKQRKEIKKVLYSIQDFQYNDSALIEVLAKERDQEMIELALKHLNTYNKQKPIWLKELNLIRAIVRISKRNDLESILLEIDKMSIYSRNMKLNQLTSKFINRVKVQQPTKCSR